MSVIHALILLFLWIVTSYLAIKNIEEYYHMQKKLKKRNERIGVIFVVLVCLLFRSVISTYIIYVLMLNALYYVIHKVFKNKFLDKSFYLCFIIPIIIVILGVINVEHLHFTTYNLENSDISEDIKMAYVSDVHLSTLSSNKLEKIVSKVSAKDYDVFVIDGDLIDEFSKDSKTREVIKRLGTIKTKYGLYYVEGNHDLLNNKRRSYLLESGFRVLEDEGVLINNNFYLLGRRDLKDKKRVDLNSLTYNLDRPAILLDHQPNVIKNMDSRIMVQLSGHTHAGQIWPLGYFLKYGYYKDKRLIVSSGVGAWHNQVRTSKYSEIVEINIKKVKNF